MSSPRSQNIIPLARARLPGDTRVQRSSREACLFYTLDLLMEDFGKKHQREYCALCEPMRVLRLHRDEAIVKLTVALFTTFFPDFEEYLQETKESMVQKLLRRTREPSFRTWQEKLRGHLRDQIKKDAQSFFSDVQKHLKKYSEVEMDGTHEQTLLGRAISQLNSEWIPKKFRH